MAKGTIYQTDFSAGELSPRMLGRVDLPQYGKGAQAVENWQVLPQGGITKRPGTEYIGKTGPSQDGTEARIIPYIYSATEAYIIELCNSAITVWRNGSVVAETSTPSYTLSQIWDINYAYDHNGVYFTHPSHAPAALIRTATDSFTWGNISFTYHTGAVYTSHATNNDLGDDTVECTASIGATTPQQGTFYIKHPDGTQDEYTYTSYTGAIFSGVSPTLKQDYDNTYSVVVGHEYHTGGSTPCKPFGEANSYPRSVAVVGGRFWFAGTLREPQTIWASESYGYFVNASNVLVVQMLMFKVVTSQEEVTKPTDEWADPEVPETETVTYITPIISPAHGIQMEIASGSGDAIHWMASNRNLVIGTAAAQWVVPVNISATQPYAELLSRYGSGTVPAETVGSSLIMVNGERVFDFGYSMEGGGLTPNNITVHADHICKDGVDDFAYSQQPIMNLYFVRDDGTLLVCTYERSSQVVAWSRWTSATRYSGDFVSVAVVPESGKDVLYAVIKRWNIYYLEKFDSLFPDDQADAIHMDSWKDVSGDLGGTASVPWGALSRYVDLVVDGVYEGELASNAGGDVDLSGYSGTTAYLGLRWTAKVETMPPPRSLLENRRVNNVFVQLYRTMDLKVAYETWTSSDGEDFALGDTWVSGARKLLFPGQYDREAPVRLMSDVPEPCTITLLGVEVMD